MLITKAHKIKLNPTPEQERYFWKATSAARFAFNWGLARYNLYLDYNRQVEAAGVGDKIKVNGRSLKKEFTQKRPEWVTEITTWAVQGAFDDLQNAFNMFWKKSKNKTLPKANKPRRDNRPNGWPSFKSKYRTTPSFYIANQSLKFDGYNVQFDKGRVGFVNMTEQLRLDGKILAGRISYSQGQWWLSVQVQFEIEEPIPNQDAVGIDLGIKYLAVTSDGVLYENPRALQQALKKLRRLQRKLDRQRRANNPDCFNEDGTAIKGKHPKNVSRKMRETEKQITKLHAHISNIRLDATHKLTTDIARNYGIIGIEDLNIKGMMSNRKLAKAIADAALYEKRRQLEYKAGHNGGIVISVNRWFPSSKMCGGCGWINSDLKLSTRQWICPECGQDNHRDGNAAVNIRNEAVRILTNE